MTDKEKTEMLMKALEEMFGVKFVDVTDELAEKDTPKVEPDKDQAYMAYLLESWMNLRDIIRNTSNLTGMDVLHSSIVRKYEDIISALMRFYFKSSKITDAIFNMVENGEYSSDEFSAIWNTWKASKN